jgi:hypothetical protein
MNHPTCQFGRGFVRTDGEFHAEGMRLGMLPATGDNYRAEVRVCQVDMNDVDAFGEIAITSRSDIFGHAPEGDTEIRVMYHIVYQKIHDGASASRWILRPRIPGGSGAAAAEEGGSNGPVMTERFG